MVMDYAGMESSDNPMIVQGAQVLKDGPQQPFEGDRKCNDIPFAIFFVITTGFLGYMTTVGYAELKEQAAFVSGSTDMADVFLAKGAPGVALASAAAMVTGMIFLQMCRCMPTCLVYTALLLGPAMMIASGLAMLMVQPIIGACLLAGGLCIGGCLLFCWKDLIPFTAAVVETIAMVIQKHFAMYGICIFGGIMSLIWTMACVVAFFGALASVQSKGAGSSGHQDEMDPALGQGLLFITFFVMYWGGYVVLYTCHTANCGVFGRWYFGLDNGSPVCESLKVALGPSFGSICFGAFIIAVIRALEAMAKQLRESDSPVVQIVGCIIQCLLSCIGDLVEWFSGFAYVQVALRGFSFCESVKATFALCKFSNIELILAASLVGSVAGLASLACSMVAMGVGCAWSWPYNLEQLNSVDQGAAMNVAVATTVMSFFSGIVIGAGMLQTIESGGNTLMVCFAEWPDGLRGHAPELAEKFEELTSPVEQDQTS